jgi:hypothetical protein
MKSNLIDVPVLLIFFTRIEKTKKVFDEIKKARPSKLYLYQDGPRIGRPDDKENIAKCREYVTNIDWDCEVFTRFQEFNFGCDPSEFISQKWMFEKEEYGIVLEDDDVPSQSFFPFCKELLEKYRYDNRINMICGMNSTGVSEHIDESYLFTQKGSIWGWASWKRIIDSWDGEYTWLDDEKNIVKLKNAINDDFLFKKMLKNVKTHKATGKPHYESINAASMYFNNRLNIVPKYNMISNIGVDAETTHNVSDVKLLPRLTRKLFYMVIYEIDFPLKHPKYVTRDLKFEKDMTPSKLKSFIAEIEGILLRITYGEFNSLRKGLKRRIHSLLHT